MSEVPLQYSVFRVGVHGLGLKIRGGLEKVAWVEAQGSKFRFKGFKVCGVGYSVQCLVFSVQYFVLCCLVFSV